MYSRMHIVQHYAHVEEYLSLLIHPADDHVWSRHLSIRRQPEANPTIRPHAHCELHGASSGVEVPVQSVAGMQLSTEAIACTQNLISTCLVLMSTRQTQHRKKDQEEDGRSCCMHSEDRRCTKDCMQCRGLLLLLCRPCMIACWYYMRVYIYSQHNPMYVSVK